MILAEIEGMIKCMFIHLNKDFNNDLCSLGIDSKINFRLIKELFLRGF